MEGESKEKVDVVVSPLWRRIRNVVFQRRAKIGLFVSDEPGCTADIECSK